MNLELEPDLVEECNKLINLGNSLFNIIELMNNNEIEGLDKLKTNIRKDINFLSKTLEEQSLKKDHLVGSIIYQYNELLLYASRSNNCTAVLKAFRFKAFPTQKKEGKLYVDIVSEGKKKWTKIVRKNPKSLSIISSGEGDFGRKSIIDQAKEFLGCANQNLRFFKSPVVEFYFASGIERSLAESLTELGIHVSGSVLMELPNEITEERRETALPTIDCRQPFQKQEISNDTSKAVMKLNLDVNTMISYVTDLTNGGTEMEFEGKIMIEQAKEERDCPLKPTLDKLFEGKQLVACESAVQSFCSILEVQGGEGERARGEELLERLTVVRDVKPPWGELEGAKKRAAVVFATGASLGAVTVTASMGFVNALRKKGFDVDVIIHEPRSLSEMKGKKRSTATWSR